MQRRKFIKNTGIGIAGFSLLPHLTNAMIPGDTVVELLQANPKDNGKAMVNPGMGYMGYYYSHYLDMYGAKLKPSDALEWFPGESTVYLRVTWAQLEPEEGKFNWTLLDTPAQRWIDAGKQCSFRVSCHETGLKFATPEWVKDAGTQGYDIDIKGGFPTHSRITDEEGHTWEPVYNDPVFLEKLDNFLKAMSERYDGNEKVAFVDIGSFGTWGEGHTVHASKIKYPFATFKTHIDLHKKHFKNTLLCISDDVDGWNNTNGNYPIMDYARSQGVTMRDDSILSGSTEGILYYHKEMADRFWPTMPVIMEHAHYKSIKERNAWGKNGKNILQAVEDYHATYLSIHYWPHKYFEENRDVIEKMNLRLGFRLQMKKIAYPKEVKIGEPFKVQSSWLNSAVAPCYAGGYPCFTIKDEEGGIVSTHVDRNLNVRDLKVAAVGKAQDVTIESELTVAMGFNEVFKGEEKQFSMTADAGEYEMYISIGKLDGTPVYQLPYNNEDGHRRYKVGKIRLNKRL